MLSVSQRNQAVEGENPSTAKPRFSRSKMPVLAIVLTIIGDFIYLNFGVGLFIGLAASGLFLYWTTVLFVTTVGVLVSVAMMMARPMLHRIWGILVLAFSGWALSADGNFLYGSYDYASSIVGPIAIIGTIISSIPLALVLIGGVSAIFWKPPAFA